MLSVIVFTAFMKLTDDDQDRLMDDLEEVLGRNQGKKIEPPRNVEPDASYVDRCQSLLGEHPDGLTSSEIGVAIGQTREAADSTVRWLKAKAPGHIEKRGDRWVLLQPFDKKKQLRDYIREVLTNAKGPLNSGDIIPEVMKLRAHTNHGSIKSELLRMAKAEVLFVVGSNARGKLYSLTPKGGSHPK